MIEQVFACTPSLLNFNDMCTGPLLRGEGPGNGAIMYHDVLDLYLLASRSVKTT